MRMICDCWTTDFWYISQKYSVNWHNSASDSFFNCYQWHCREQLNYVYAKVIITLPLCLIYRVCQKSGTLLVFEFSTRLLDALFAIFVYLHIIFIKCLISEPNVVSIQMDFPARPRSRLAVSLTTDLASYRLLVDLSRLAVSLTTD